MQWTNSTPLTLLILLLLHQTPLSTALSTARIWANFYPTCPSSHIDEPTSLHLDEQFTTAVDIDANICQGIPVPLQYAPTEVDHLAIDAELLTKDPLDVCRIKVHELPGCSAYTPLVDEELVHGGAVSACKTRGFAYTQVWLELECTKVPRPVAVEGYLRGSNTNVTGNATGRYERRGKEGLWERVVRQRRAMIPTR